MSRTTESNAATFQLTFMMVRMTKAAAARNSDMYIVYLSVVGSL
mgnify:FL=1